MSTVSQVSSNEHNEEWARAETYHNSFLIAPDPILDQVRANCVANNIPDIAVSDSEGKFLNLVVKTSGAKRILEVGTLGGYSAILMARALPNDGELVTLEVNPEHVALARENIQLAGLQTKVKVIEGSAVDTIATLGPDASFDLAFIDADKVNNVAYYEHAKRLLKSNGIIIVDNVNHYGHVSDPNYNDAHPWTVGVRELLKVMKEDTEVGIIEATTINTVGLRGFDGFIFARKP